MIVVKNGGFIQKAHHLVVSSHKNRPKKSGLPALFFFLTRSFSSLVYFLPSLYTFFPAGQE